MKHEKKVYIFWDNSNIFISAKHVAESRDGFGSRELIRIHFTNLIKLALAGRMLGKIFVVGSIPPEQRDVWDRMKHGVGVEPELYERGANSGSEQGLDQCLQTHMLRVAYDENEPQIAVLLTGDGAGYDVGTGFFADLERLHKRGWGVEVLAWDISCKRQLKEWVAREGVYVKLEDYYDAVTYIKDGRRLGGLNLTHRKKVGVGSAPEQHLKDKVGELTGHIESLQRENERANADIEKYKYQLRATRRAQKKKNHR